MLRSSCIPEKPIGDPPFSWSPRYSLHREMDVHGPVIILQMNSTWNRATGSITYQIVCNRKPCYKRIPVAQRAFEQVEFREISAGDDADDLFNRIHANEINEAEERLSAPISQAEADFRECNEFPELIDDQYEVLRRLYLNLLLRDHLRACRLSTMTMMTRICCKPFVTLK